MTESSRAIDDVTSTVANGRPREIGDLAPGTLAAGYDIETCSAAAAAAPST